MNVDHRCSVLKPRHQSFYRLHVYTLDTAIQHRPSKHIFVLDKADWETICGGLPQYD